jgi:putative ABC transport system substrate-binding protein
MRRRAFLRLFGGAAASAWCGARPLLAQQAGAVKARLGILIYSTPQTDPNTASLLRGLRELGYVDGQNLDIQFRAAEGRPERLPGLAAELVALKPQLIFSLGGDVTSVAVKAAPDLPLVFVSSADPVQLGFVASYARPGGHATGVTLLLDELASKRLELLKEAAPGVSRVAVVWSPDHVDNELQLAERAASRVGVKLLPLPIRGPDGIAAALAAAGDAQADALYVVASRQTVLNIGKFAEFANRNRLPLAGGWGAWAQAGALLSYGPNVDEMVRLAAGYVPRIIKGAKPADLPVQQPTRFELHVNLKSARALGLSIPESFLLRADKVIE